MFSLDGILPPLIGGVLIGLSAGLLMMLNGRILGISGILGGLLGRWSPDTPWRVALVAGLVVGGAVTMTAMPEAYESTLDRSTSSLVAAGLLVGFGTRLGSGCTSGHGVCGLARFSRRSLVAVGTFIAAGMAVAAIVTHVFGGAV